MQGRRMNGVGGGEARAFWEVLVWGWGREWLGIWLPLMDLGLGVGWLGCGWMGEMRSCVVLFWFSEVCSCMHGFRAY